MRLIDEQYTRTPFYGSPRLTHWLRGLGYVINPKRVARLMQSMGLQAIYPKPRTSVAAPGHRIYPYLLRNVTIERVNQVWSTDITYIRLPTGWIYLVAIMDWKSRGRPLGRMVAWQVSINLDSDFCVQALGRALQRACPEVFNSDQGSQFTSAAFTDLLKAQQIRISMDGRGRCFDNILLERLWRTVKYEEVYLKEYQSVSAAGKSLAAYFEFYNQQRPHAALNNQTPAAVYFEH